MFGEVALADVGADAGRRGIGVAEVGVVALERLELAEALVVLGVAEGGAIEDVVVVLGTNKQRAQFRRARRLLG